MTPKALHNRAPTRRSARLCSSCITVANAAENGQSVSGGLLARTRPRTCGGRGRASHEARGFNGGGGQAGPACPRARSRAWSRLRAMPWAQARASCSSPRRARMPVAEPGPLAQPRKRPGLPASRRCYRPRYLTTRRQRSMSIGWLRSMTTALTAPQSLADALLFEARLLPPRTCRISPTLSWTTWVGGRVDQSPSASGTCAMAEDPPVPFAASPRTM
jgi:hypothetical protein